MSLDEQGFVGLPQIMRRGKSQSNATIYIDELMEHYMCPICFDEIERCQITQCGHNFCEKCIKECINRKHVCPLCNAETHVEQLIKNVHFDSVLSKLKRARQASSEEYVNQLMQKTMEESKQNAPNAATSPLSKIFTQYTSANLVKYENYYQQMFRDMNKMQTRLQSNLQQNLYALIPPISTLNKRIKAEQPGSEQESNANANANVHSNSNDNDNENNGGSVNNAHHNDVNDSHHSNMSSMDQQIQDLFLNIFMIEGGQNEQFLQSLQTKVDTFLQYIQSQHQNESNALNLDLTQIASHFSVYMSQMKLCQSRFDKSCKLLFESYEEYMRNCAPSPFLLPIAITIRLRGRPQFWDLKFQSTDQIGSVVNLLKKNFKELGDPVNQFLYEHESANDNSNNNNNKQTKKIKLGILRPMADRNPEQPLEITTDLEKCFGELHIRPGTQIHILTQFELQSEKARPCFTYKYDKSANATCDYYRCKDCGFNWVCKACSIQCHKGHTLVPFMMNHTPSYACCYCVKKKKCKILNSKSKQR